MPQVRQLSWKNLHYPCLQFLKDLLQRTGTPAMRLFKFGHSHSLMEVYFQRYKLHPYLIHVATNATVARTFKINLSVGLEIHGQNQPQNIIGKAIQPS
jgi:hypothetical protein